MSRADEILAAHGLSAAENAVEEAAASPDAPAFWAARPELTLIRDWARARRVAPYALLGEVLAALACRVSPDVRLPAIIAGPGSLNQLVALVAAPGGGKGGAQSVALEAIDWGTTKSPPVLPLGSGEGIAATFGAGKKLPSGGFETVRTGWNALLVAREIDKFAALMDRRGGTISADLRAMWSGEELGSANATADRRIVIPRHTYRAVATFGVQPDHAGALLSDEGGGLPQRVIWLPGRDPGAPDTAPDVPARFRWEGPPELRSHDPDVQGLDNLGASPADLPVCETARIAIDRAAVARHRGKVDALDGHALHAREKLAACLALLNGHFGIRDSDWELSGHLMAVSDSTRAGISVALRRAEEQRNEARGYADAKRARIIRQTEESDALAKASTAILNKLSDPKKTGWTSHSDLRKQVWQRHREFFEDAIEILLKESKIEYRDRSRGSGGHGGPGTEYRVAP